MSTTVALLGLGHLAGVLGRLHAAALVAPEAAHIAEGADAAAASRAAVPAGRRRAVEVRTGRFLVTGQPSHDPLRPYQQRPTVVLRY